MKKLIIVICLLAGCDRLEVHHWKITDLKTGKSYIAERNNLTPDQSGSRDCYRHIFGDGITFQLHDGTWVEIDNSFSAQQID